MSQPILLPQTLIADPSYQDIKRHIIENTGLAYYLDKDSELAEKVSKRLSRLGMGDGFAYLDLLKSGPGGEEELDELIGDLTIGETYFFRYQEQFEALRQAILPQLFEKNRAQRRLRIWSAGCSNGAESYSLSILIRREFGPEIKDWDITLLGTDINRKFLAQAREGCFGDWAFRGVPEEIRGSCFVKTGGVWKILEEYRQGVSFEYHNLVAHPYPSLLHNLTAFDLILCRNVMIYFSQEVIQECIRRFWKTLVEDGWLVAGYAESNPDFYRSFRAVEAPGALLFQRSKKATEGRAPEQYSEAMLPPHAVGKRPPDPEKPEAREPAVWKPPSLPEIPLLSRFPIERPQEKPVQPSQEPAITRIRELADWGEWDEAAGLCKRLVEKDGLNPLGHFYYALVLEQMGRLREAAVLLQRAIYLDRGFVLAYYHQGLFLQREGDARGAGRSFRNALGLLERMDRAQTFPDADSISVADLADLARMQLEILEGGRP